MGKGVPLPLECVSKQIPGRVHENLKLTQKYSFVCKFRNLDASSYSRAVPHASNKTVRYIRKLHTCELRYI